MGFRSIRRSGGFGKHLPSISYRRDSDDSPTYAEATAVKLWRNAQWVSSEALAKEDTLRRVPPKTQEGPRLLSRGAPLQPTTDIWTQLSIQTRKSNKLQEASLPIPEPATKRRIYEVSPMFYRKRRQGHKVRGV